MAKRSKTAPWSLSDVPMDVPPRETWRVDWRDHATSALRAYNDGLLANSVRSEMAKAGRWVVKSSALGTLEVLYASTIWARRRGADPFVWVRWIGQRVRSCDDSVARSRQLFDEELFAVFASDHYGAHVVSGAEVDDALHRQLGSAGFVAGRDRHEGAEIAKRHFVARGREVLCIDAHDIHFGFLASSPTCGACSLRERCKGETSRRLSP